ncbi:uncharacterized protein LOC119027234 isoform X4 [Acanthopagrus latus]|nr:uncharacterized protein LOC119027234 isoform X4 [Acanthopagrus latus]
MGGSAAQGASRASEMTSTTASSHQRCSNQRPVHQHLIPNSSGPVGPQAPGSPFPCRPHPVLTLLVPQLMWNPCFPPWPNRMNTNPVASTSNPGFGLSPRVMAPFWCAPPPPPQFYLHLLHPSGCLRLQSVPPPQLCCPDLVLRGAAQQVDEQLCATATSEQSAERAESEEGQQENDDAYGKTEFNVSPGPLPSVDEESLAERVFEEYMAIMDSLGLQIPEGEQTGENEEEEKNRKVEYLEKLFSDEDFIRGVDSILNPEDSLDRLLSVDPQPTDVPLQELQHEQDSYPPSSNSNAATEQTPPATSRVQRAQPPVATQSDTSPNHDGQNSTTSARNSESNDGWTGSSPVRLQEPLQTNATTGHIDIVNIFELIDSSLQLLANISLDASSTSDVESRDSDSPFKKPAAIFPSEGPSEESSNVAETQMSRNLQEGDSPSLEFSSVSGSNMDACAIAAKDSAPGFRADLLTVNLSAQIRKPEECIPKNTNLTPSCLEVFAVPEQTNSSFVEDSHTESCDTTVDEDSCEQDLDLALQDSQEVASSGVSSEERQETDRKCEENLGKGVPTTLSDQARKERSTFDGSLTEIEKMEQQQELKVDGDQGSHTALKEKDLGESTEQRQEEGPPESGYVMRRRSWSKTSEEKVEPTSSPATRTGGKIKLSEMAQDTTEAQNLLDSSQVPNKENVSGGSPRVHSTHDSVKDDRSQRQESPKGLMDEINEFPFGKNCEKTPHLTPPETQKRQKTVAGTTTSDFYSLRSGTHKPKVSKGKGEKKTVEDPPSSPDHTAGMQGQSLNSSPMKRYRQDRKSSEEGKARLNETDTIVSSPTKRGRWSKKDEAQVETPGCKPTPPLRRSCRKSLNLSAGQETVVTRASRKGTNKRKTRRSKKLPTKYKDFILYNRQLGKEKGKAGRGRRAR